MKKLMILALAGLLMAGCSGVTMNAEYSARLDSFVAKTELDATLALNKKLDANDMTSALVDHYARAKEFQDARDGVDGGLPKPK
jgi:uncharacterized protein YcfL